jgi:hypothetical protein
MRLILCSAAALMGAWALSVLGAAGCSSTPEPRPPPQGGLWEHSPRVCGLDEVREYFCDELVPLGSSLPGDAPYEDCPGSIETHVGDHEPRPSVAAFDLDYTRYMRKRAPPGHSCCYSWCASLRVAETAELDPWAGCNATGAFREVYCVSEPEAGASQPAPAPAERCPAAIVPEPERSFSVPEAAALDMQVTLARRGAGFEECCYGWCSMAPSGAGL